MDKLLLFLFLLLWMLGNVSSKKSNQLPVVESTTPTTITSATNALPAIRKVYVINLEKRPERMKSIATILDDLKIPFERFEAFDFGNGSENALRKAESRFLPGTKFNTTIVAQDLQVNGSVHQTWGSTGCWQSHLQVYMTIVSQNLPGPYLILEDDIKVSPKIIAFLSFRNMFEKLPHDWDVLLLDSYFLKCHKDKSVPKGLCKVQHSFTTSGYVLRNIDVAKKFIEYGNTAHMQVADHYWNDMFKKGKIVAYTTFNKIVTQAMDVFPSDIKSSQENLKKVFEEYKAGV